MKVNLKNPGYIIVYGAVVSAVFTAAIMSLHKATGSIVQRNEMLYERKGIVQLFDLADVGTASAERVLEIYDRQVQSGPEITDPRSGQRFQVLRAYDEAGNLLGYAFPIGGNGFWANITGYLAVTPDLSEIVGITFLAHSETPGLGGRLTETQFRDQFVGLTVTPPEPGNQFIYVGGPQQDRRWVDSITGATGTSKAIERFVNEDIARFRRAAEADGLAGTNP